MLIPGLLLTIAAGCFLAHVILLFTSFSHQGFQKSRYFFSHLTLWFTGLALFVFAFAYSGKKVSDLADFFNTPFRQVMILCVVVALSLVAHLIVRFLVLPAVVGSDRGKGRG